jgi:hypothetical protein
LNHPFICTRLFPANRRLDHSLVDRATFHPNNKDTRFSDHYSPQKKQKGKIPIGEFVLLIDGFVSDFQSETNPSINKTNSPIGKMQFACEWLSLRIARVLV